MGTIPAPQFWVDDRGRVMFGNETEPPAEFRSMGRAFSRTWKSASPQEAAQAMADNGSRRNDVRGAIESSGLEFDIDEVKFPPAPEAPVPWEDDGPTGGAPAPVPHPHRTPEPAPDGNPNEPLIDPFAPASNEQGLPDRPVGVPPHKPTSKQLKKLKPRKTTGTADASDC